MYRSIYYIFLSFSQNIVFNYYLFLFALFPTYFKNSVVNAKKTSDNYYNKMMLLAFTDDIYNKYHIDLIDVHANIIKYINEDKKNDDNISIMSDLSDMSDLSSTSNFCDE
jgi:hypothetical protein